MRLRPHVVCTLSAFMSKTSAHKNAPAIVVQAPCRADLAGGTLDLWPLYLFHPGALTLNFALNILTTCRVTPLRGKSVHLRSLDTKREQRFASFDELSKTTRFRLPLAARLLQFFAPRQGLLIETDSESPAGAGISGSSALMIATTAALACFTERNLTLEQMRVIAQNSRSANHQRYHRMSGLLSGTFMAGSAPFTLDADGIHREVVGVSTGRG